LRGKLWSALGAKGSARASAPRVHRACTKKSCLKRQASANSWQWRCRALTIVPVFPSLSVFESRVSFRVMYFHFLAGLFFCNKPIRIGGRCGIRSESSWPGFPWLVPIIRCISPNRDPPGNDARSAESVKLRRSPPTNMLIKFSLICERSSQQDDPTTIPRNGRNDGVCHQT